MKKRVTSEKENFLDYIPRRNSCYDYRINERGNVEIIVPNRGFFNRALQILMGKPKQTYVELEEMGSFIWQTMDGKKSVYDLACLERDRFGERSEPVYERLSAYLKTLRECGYIVYENKIKNLLN